jgi:dihydroneopterin aldolase
MDTIYLKNYTVVAKHGYYKEEHAKEQRFVVSVYVTTDTKKAGETDDLRETLNYELIRSSVRDILMRSPHNLLESLAEEIANTILENPHTATVQVEIEKPDVWHDSTPGVRILRAK